MVNEPMTKEQIANFRKALLISIGPYAMIMPEEDVIKIRDNMQAHLNKGAETK